MENLNLYLKDVLTERPHTLIHLYIFNSRI